ncbi:MAG: hypothetical protein FWD50_07665, partial [Betaproteobacteria bacterium]|nr:hypothetical protein [Betaproteobacteria bacterium]
MRHLNGLLAVTREFICADVSRSDPDRRLRWRDVWGGSAEVPVLGPLSIAPHANVCICNVTDDG